MPATRHSLSIKPLAVTMGEPAGIGGEIALKAWQARNSNVHPFVVIDSPDRLQKLVTHLGIDIPLQSVQSVDQVASTFDSALPVLDLEHSVSFRLGDPDPANGSAVCRSIERAVALTLANETAGVVTTPIQKKTLYDAGFPYPGHTEFVAHLTGGHAPTMMLAAPQLRVVPVTIHQSLSSAIADLTPELIITKCQATAKALAQDFGISNPKLAVAGLNPHAGEDGTLGTEEIDIISPAIRSLRDSGLDVLGPVPPDALFTPRARTTYDAAVCHYHDQALIPIKALAIDEAVNVTLGLPIVRTSPDHGTALDIADKGIADPQSFLHAVKMASEIAANRLGATHAP